MLEKLNNINFNNISNNPNLGIEVGREIQNASWIKSPFFSITGTGADRGVRLFSVASQQPFRPRIKAQLTGSGVSGNTDFEANYDNLEILSQPEAKEITNELLKQLQNMLNSNSQFSEQVELSLKGIVRILEVLLSLDFFKNANEIDSSLRNSIEWISNAGESLKIKMKEYESFFNDFNASMKANEQEVTNTLNANTQEYFYLKRLYQSQGNVIHFFGFLMVSNELLTSRNAF